MTVKLLHYWTIINSRKDDYNKFVLKKFIPGVNQLGLHTVAGWCVLVGAYSEIVMECVASDLDRLEQALNDPRYKKLKSDLLNSVKSYKTKVLVETGKASSYSTDIAEDTVKFNQTWNLIGEKKEAYGQFTRKEYYPLMEELGIVIAGEWEVLIGDSPSIICEGRVNDVSTLIQNLQSQKFRESKTMLKEYIEDYQSRILTFHIQKVKGYKSASYRLISD
jgi:hypothetical protein